MKERVREPEKMQAGEQIKEQREGSKEGQNGRTMDMTVGSPIGHILRFALPLLVGNVFQQLYNMVDSLVVGNYVGANALAAVGNCGSMNNLFFALANGLSIGIPFWRIPLFIWQ